MAPNGAGEWGKLSLMPNRRLHHITPADPGSAERYDGLGMARKFSRKMLPCGLCASCDTDGGPHSVAQTWIFLTGARFINLFE